VDGGGVRAHAVERAGLEQLFDGGADVAEVLEHDAGVAFEQPVAVVALLRHGPGVAFDDDGELHCHGFRRCCRAGLADHEVGDGHEAGDLGGEALDVDGDACGQGAQAGGE
jgi:hypothetical protein